MRERFSVRVLLLSPSQRLLLIHYRNIGKDGVSRPCWTTAGGGMEAGESVEQAAAREITEETGLADAKLGPIVWYGEDARRSGDWQVRHKEHFIVAFAPTEQLRRNGWTDHERAEILEMRWWAVEDIRASGEDIYPRNLGALLQPLLNGVYPESTIRLPDIGL